MAKRPSVKALVKDLEADELREVIAELCKLSPKNRQFLELYLQSSETASPEPVVEEAKKKVNTCFYGRGQFPKLDLGGARKVVREYCKVLKEYPCFVAELKLYYVEVGTQITDEYGDMYEGFYSSLVSMYEDFCRDVKGHPSWYDDFEDRIRKIQSTTYYMGWGYGDDIDALTTELQEKVQSRSSESEEEGGSNHAR